MHDGGHLDRRPHEKLFDVTVAQTSSRSRVILPQVESDWHATNKTGSWKMHNLCEDREVK